MRNGNWTTATAIMTMTTNKFLILNVQPILHFCFCSSIDFVVCCFFLVLFVSPLSFMSLFIQLTLDFVPYFYLFFISSSCSCSLLLFLCWLMGVFFCSFLVSLTIYWLNLCIGSIILINKWFSSEHIIKPHPFHPSASF